MNKELHVFIIWEKGLFLAEPIIKDIAERFKIRQIFNIKWAPSSFARHLAELYGKSLPKGCRKEKECGCGRFKMIVVEDNAPRYADGQNMNMVEAKIIYRRWFQGRNYLHCSDCRAEGISNLEYILGISCTEFCRHYGKSSVPSPIDLCPEEEAQALSPFAVFSRKLLQGFNLW